MDLYKQIASERFNVPYEEVTPEQRHEAKVCAFACYWGQSLNDGDVYGSLDMIKSVYGPTLEKLLRECLEE